jgi:hypothetical protein
MTEVFSKYGPETEGDEPIRCVVAHPDAGGQCGQPAVGEVWALPFCEIHGREAELAYMDERNKAVGNKLEALADAENKRHDRDPGLLEALKAALAPPDVDHAIYEKAMADAYPPDELAGNIDPDILAFDYEEIGSTPYDWWCEARLMVVRFMRQAAVDAPEILDDLELLRERATVQQLLAGRDLDRRWRKTAPA